MSGKILIAFASKTNATAQHAGAIAGSLKGLGRDIDIIDLRQTGKPSLDGYDSIVIGSGVRFGRWYGPARKMLKRRELAGKKIALFISCGVLADEPAKCDEAVRNYIDAIAGKYGIKPISSCAFVGFMPDGKSMKLGSASDSRPVDISKSEEWGRELAKIL
jgi:menaquinone-dependent protoporphyrinogen oxidase